MKLYINNDSNCCREILLRLYNVMFNNECYGYVCCDICVKDCKCDKGDCNSFDYLYDFYVDNDDDEIIIIIFIIFIIFSIYVIISMFIMFIVRCSII